MFHSPPSYRRTLNDIVLYLNRNQPTPTIIPVELTGQVSPEEWYSRISAVSVITNRFSKPLIEKIWAVVSLLAILFVPFGLYHVIYRALVDDMGQRDAAIQGRAISGVLFIAVALVMVLPMFAWKLVGRLQVNRLVRRWEASDRQKKPGSAVLKWHVKPPSVFREGTVLTVSLPFNNSPSLFHPGAYLPSYINGPADDYHYPYKPGGEPGLPRMSVVGRIPMYNSSNEKQEYYGSDTKV